MKRIVQNPDSSSISRNSSIVYCHKHKISEISSRKGISYIVQPKAHVAVVLGAQNIISIDVGYTTELTALDKASGPFQLRRLDNRRNERNDHNLVPLNRKKTCYGFLIYSQCCFFMQVQVFCYSSQLHIRFIFYSTFWFYEQF